MPKSKAKAKPRKKPTAAVVEVKPHAWTDSGEHVLVLRRINRDGTSYGGFRWPEGVDVEVSAPDWSAKAVCGGGLHGWPWGMGLGEGSDYSLIDDRWLVIAAKPEDVCGELGGGCKCKLKTGRKIYDGHFAGAWALINSGRHRLIEAMSKSGAPNVASGDYSTAASSGHSSKAASSGDYSTAASSGHSSTAASSGDYSTAASSGDYSTAASSGDYSKAASSGHYSTAASSGHSSKAASSGDYSTAASSGHYSTAASEGRDTIAVAAGSNCRVRVGERGAFALPYWTDGIGWRFLCGKVGENGVKAYTWYRIENGVLTECD